MDSITCKECGKEQNLVYSIEINSELVNREECHSCNHFLSILRKRDQSDCFRINGIHYMAIAEQKQTTKAYRGFGGRLFKIIPLDGRPAFISDNVWCQGEIPSHLRDRMPDNATFGKIDE
jgi:hypothetical protein